MQHVLFMEQYTGRSTTLVAADAPFRPEYRSSSSYVQAAGDSLSPTPLSTLPVTPSTASSGNHSQRVVGSPVDDKQQDWSTIYDTMLQQCCQSPSKSPSRSPHASPPTSPRKFPAASTPKSPHTSISVPKSPPPGRSSADSPRSKKTVTFSSHPTSDNDIRRSNSPTPSPPIANQSMPSQSQSPGMKLDVEEAFQSMLQFSCQPMSQPPKHPSSKRLHEEPTENDTSDMAARRMEKQKELQLVPHAADPDQSRQLSGIFDQLDMDKDGYVVWAEIKESARMMGFKTKKWFDAMDSNRDKEVTREEWLAFWEAQIPGAGFEKVYERARTMIEKQHKKAWGAAKASAAARSSLVSSHPAPQAQVQV